MQSEDRASTVEIDRLLEAVRGRPARDRLLVHLIAEYSLSLPQALSARLVDAEGGGLEVEDKFGRSRRIELAGDAAAALEELKAFADALPEVFVSRAGRSFGRAEARRLLLMTARRAGLADVSLRDLRRRISVAA